MGTHNSKEHKTKQKENRQNEPPSENGAAQHIDAEGSNAAENGDASKSTVQFNPVTQNNPMSPNSTFGVQARTIKVAGNVVVKIGIQQENEKQEKSEDFIHRFTALQDMLKRHYRTLSFKGLPWMGNINLALSKYYVKLLMSSSDTSGPNKQPQNTIIEDTFTASNGPEKLTRILVEGAAGFGKTTLAAKLTYDWAQNEKYVSHFDLVLFSSLRHYTKDWKQILIKAAKLHEDKDCEMLFKYLEQNNRILIIFDGYDELHKKYTQEVNSIIRREILRDTTVVVTSRPGKFSSNVHEKDRVCSIDLSEVVSDINQFFNKRIMVMGFDDAMQKDFIRTHTEGFPKTIRDSVLKNINEMKNNSILTTEFLQCPLFLLMVVLLLTGNRAANVQNFKTRTDLYKKVFNFVVRRYFSKFGDSSVPEIDLFSVTRNTTSTHLSLMIQFSRFALNAIQQNVLAFSREEILENCGDLESATTSDLKQLKWLELGFLKASVLEEGFFQQTIYEPIHKSILEFAAAYFIWSSFHSDEKEFWLNLVLSVRLRKVGVLDSSASLTFPFLAGLMGDEACHLFETLHPYATEYSLSSDLLKLSIHETLSAPKLVNSLIPLLPLTMDISRNDSNFAVWKHHEEIIRCGSKQGKIKVVEWDPSNTQTFPLREVMIDRLILCSYEPCQWKYDKISSNCVRCLHLWCRFKSLEGSSKSQDWERAIMFAHNIQFTRISFFTEGYSNALPLIFEAVTTGVLKNVDINCFTYQVDDSRENLYAMIRNNRIQTLELLLYESPGLCDPLCTALYKKDFYHMSYGCFARECRPLDQKELDYLLKCASHSTRLVRFMIDNHPCNPPLVVDMSLLCDRGHKSWKMVCLRGVTIHTSLEVEKDFEIGHLKITGEDENTVLNVTNNVLHYCNVLSFACRHSSMMHNAELPICINSVSELLLQLSSAINCHEFWNVCNLQVLVLEMTPSVSEKSMHILMENLFSSTHNTLSLRGIELLGVEYNPRCVEIFVNHISNIYGMCEHKPFAEGYFEPNNTPKRLHPLKYVMFHTELSAEKEAAFSLFLVPFLKLKTPLKEQSISRLDFTCNSNVLSYILDCEALEVASLNSIFPVSEGFKIKHDFCGMRDDDSIRNKEMYNQKVYPCNRVSVSFNKKV